MRRHFVIILTVLSAALCASANVDAPDFAYPATVKTSADSLLKVATRDNDGIRQLQALMELTVADNLIDRDTRQESVKRIIEYASRQKNRQIGALMNLYAATLSDNIYSSQRYVYDRRELPLSPRPVDMSQWSGDMFTAFIDSLCGVAMSDAGNMPLADLEKVIVSDRTQRIYFPTVADFVAARYVALVPDAKRDSIYSDIISRQRENSPTWYYWKMRSIGSAHKPLLKLYREAPDKTAALILWQNITADISQGEQILDDPEFLATLSEAKVAARNTPFENCIGNFEKMMNACAVDVECAERIPADTQYNIKLGDIANVSDVGLIFSKFPSYEARERYVSRKTGKPADRHRFDFNVGKAVHAYRDTSVSVSLPRGYYTLSVTANGKTALTGIKSLDVITALPVVYDNGGRNTVGVYDASSGQPVKDASVQIVDNKGRIKASGKTDSNGLWSLRGKKDASGYVSVSVNGFNMPFHNIRPRIYGDSRYDSNKRVSIATNRGVYHVADTVRFLVVAMADSAVIADADLDIEFTDTDGNVVDSISGTTDAFGRFAGTLAVPAKVERTGSFSIDVSGGKGSRHKDIYGSTDVTVSDFKLQGIEIRRFYAVTDMPTDSSATVKGKVYTFSGQPVPDATVNLTYNGQKTPLQTRTDAAGSFSAKIKYPEEFFDKNGDLEDEYDYVYLTADVTGPDGSTVSAETSFNTEYPYNLIANILKSMNNVSVTEFNRTSPLIVETRVWNYADTANVPLAWKMLKRESNGRLSSVSSIPVLTGTFSRPGRDSIDISALETGIYNLVITPVDTLLADGWMSPSIPVYNPNGTTLPYSDQIITVIEKEVKVSGDKATVTLGVSEPGAWVNTVIPCKDKPARVESRHYQAGYHAVEVDIAGLSEASSYIRFYTSRDAVPQNINVKVIREPGDALNLTLESFRDKVFSGSLQTWTIKTTDAKGQPVQAAVLADIHDSRVDRLNTAPGLWIRRPWMPDPFSVISLRSYSYPYGFYQKINTLRYNSIYAPDWRYTLSNYYARDRKMYKSAAVYGAMESSDMAAVAENATLDSMPVMAYGVKSEARSESLQAVVVSIDVQEDEGEAPVPYPTQQFALRDGDILDALWSPMLTTDISTGAAGITFTVPNANTTWAATVTAWTKDLTAKKLTRTFVSSKPVMVSVNAPRFMRTTDKASVIATYMNTTDSVLSVNASISVAGADSIARVLTIQPKGTETLTIDVAAPSLPGEDIYVTARAYTGSYGDGERRAIPVLESQANVVEAINFYINAADSVFSMKLPERKGKDFGLRLTFTENPMWTVVEALPDVLGKNVLPTANSQAAAYFSAATALGLMSSHPELEYTFNRNDLRKAMKQAADALIKLQGADGGWQWGPWSTASDVYTTGAVLDFMATLRRAGYLPDDNKSFTDALKKAVRYYDGAVRQTDLVYTITRPAFPEVVQSLNGRSVSDRTIQWIVKDWKKFNVPLKAQAASALHFNGNTNLARTLIGSLDQFGTQTPDKGFEFKNIQSLQAYAWLLEAYGTIVPKSPHVDGLRQYLIVRRQATDWGNSIITSWIVNAMINSGTPWCEPADGCIVRTESGVMKFKPTDRMGTLDVPVEGQNITIETTGKTPSYGAVTARYIAPMADIKAFSDGEITVEKSLLCQQDGKWVRVDSLRVGDRVKTVLTVKATRPMSQIIISDERAAALEPVDQLPGYIWAERVCAYRENRDATTNIFIDYLPKGTYIFEYELNVNNAGMFSTGLATVTCTQAPTLTAHSSGSMLSVSPMRK